MAHSPSANTPPLIAHVPDWMDTKAYQDTLQEAQRLLPVGRDREAQLIREAERAAELTHLRRKAILAERIKKATNAA
jgi:hypothetical protein